MMKKFLSLSLTCAFLANGSLSGKKEDLVEGTKPVKLAGEFKFTEGPAMGPDGNLYFTDIPNNRIHKWDPKAKKVSVFMDNSGGANGLFFSKEGIETPIWPCVKPFPLSLGNEVHAFKG